MSNKGPFPSALVWLDLETTALADGNDYSGVEILEVAVIVTDFDLKPFFGYQGVVRMNDKIKASLKNNPYVVKMHLENGLLKASKESTDTLAEIESEIVGMLKSKTTQEKGEFMLAGSGVAAYDFNLIKERMPELASWLVYYSLDIGVVRRASRILSGGAEIVGQVPTSGDEAAHRALDDVKYYIKEARLYQKLFHEIAAAQSAE